MSLYCHFQLDVSHDVIRYEWAILPPLKPHSWNTRTTVMLWCGFCCLLFTKIRKFKEFHSLECKECVNLFFCFPWYGYFPILILNTYISNIRLMIILDFFEPNTWVFCFNWTFFTYWRSWQCPCALQRTSAKPIVARITSGWKGVFRS